MSKTPPNHLVVFTVLALAGTAAHSAGSAIAPDTVIGMLQAAMAPAVNKLATTAITWLAIFTTIQFMITNYGLLKADGGIDAVIGKAVGSLVWMGVCIYIMNNGPKFIGGVGDEFFNVLGLSLPSPGAIIKNTFGVAGGMAAAAALVGAGSNTLGMLLVYIILIILAVGVFFAFKIFMIQLELALIVMLSPLSFSFLGLNALRDQGIAPFKALISLGYRIILTTVILSAFAQVSDVAFTAIKDINEQGFLDLSFGKTVDVLLSALGAYLFLAYLLLKSDSVAASLAGGHTSMGTGDVASAAAVGAAAGAAIASAGAAAAGSAGKGSQSMADVMGKIMGQGSVSNASSMGGGGQSTELSAPPPFESSGSGPDTSGKPPLMPEGGPSPASGNIGPNFDSPAPSGSGANAAIGDKSATQSTNQGSRNQPRLGERLGKVNQHIAQERAPTSVSISTHNSH